VPILTDVERHAGGVDGLHAAKGVVAECTLLPLLSLTLRTLPSTR
jgi:hypothetical protein